MLAKIARMSLQVCRMTASPRVKRRRSLKSGLRAELNHHAVGPERQGQAPAARLQFQKDAVGVLQPHPAAPLIAYRPAAAHLSVDAVDVLRAAHVVDVAAGIEPGDAEAADP